MFSIRLSILSHIKTLAQIFNNRWNLWILNFVEGVFNYDILETSARALHSP